MTLALKVLAMFTLSMGTLILKSAILIYGWLPTHMALVMGAVFFLVNMEKISKKYFDTIKSLYMHQFNSKGFKKTGNKAVTLKIKLWRKFLHMIKLF